MNQATGRARYSRLRRGSTVLGLSVWLLPQSLSYAATYEVGEGELYPSIGSVPWESLVAGDTVLIHWREEPYAEKWILARQGTEKSPITVSGVPGPNGELPVIDGNNATTRLQLDYWSEARGAIKIGGSSIPSDVMPRFIVIENLEIRGARESNSFTDDSGIVQTYQDNASSIYLEKGESITIRNCVMHDCGNGFFVASSNDAVSRDILIEGNYIHDNGNVGSAYEHNTYTAALGITYQYNRFGPPRGGSIGNGLKDRSAGLVVRYNWIEGGNRQLDLVDAEDSTIIQNDASYDETHVYGNILIEAQGTDNSQIVHYGGDSGNTSIYRKGTLYFYNNSIVSTRTGNTTWFRLSTNSETCDARNNIVYVTAAGSKLAMVDSTGVLDLSHNWFKPGWRLTHGGLQGTINDDGTSVETSLPGFVDESLQDYHLADGSSCIDAATELHPDVLPEHDLLSQYVEHQSVESRAVEGAAIDIGSFEFAVENGCDGDANGDGTVDPLDSGYVAARLGCQVNTGDPDCDSADVNTDVEVDPLDVGYVQARFGECF